MFDKKEYMKQWRQDNADKVKEYEKSYRASIEYAKIYKIVCNTTGKVYYGSTCEQRLERRLQRHETRFIAFFEQKDDRYMSSFEVICEGDYKIELVENVKCNDREELEKRERWYIQNNECVNKTVPTRTTKEKRK